MNRIGIIGAMDEEVDILVDIMDIKETIEKASLKFYKGTLEGKDIVLVRCGIGKVNSALCAQILISEFNVDAVVNTGVAGALHPELDVQDIVISTDAIQYDVDTTAFGDPKGTIPRMESSVFVADEKLINAAYESSIEESKSNRVFKGRVATGDIFISSKELKEELVNDFGAYCGEMEGGAIAHVCTLNKVPFVIIRAMSDKADGSADEKLINAAYESSIEESKSNRVFKGRVATGDIFISSKELKDELVNDFGAYCGEMEGGAIAHVCTLNKVPFVIIRAMSDKADGSADVTYDEFVQVAAHNSKDIVLNMLKSL